MRITKSKRCSVIHFVSMAQAKYFRTRRPREGCSVYLFDNLLLLYQKALTFYGTLTAMRLHTHIIR